MERAATGKAPSPIPSTNRTLSEAANDETLRL